MSKTSLRIFLLTLLSVPAPVFGAGAAPDFVETTLARARELYAPAAALEGLAFRVERREDSPLEVASADRDFLTMKIVFHAGLLRSPRLRADGFRMIVCHELGHLFGGDPRRPNPPEFEGPEAPDGLSYLSAEGQADYFAASCFRRLIDVEAPNPAPEAPASPRVRALCARAWGAGTTAARLCQRSAAGALDFLNLSKTFPISLEKEDPTITPRTLTGEYPSRQCRLDTMVAGAVRAERPRCWFKDAASLGAP